MMKEVPRTVLAEQNTFSQLDREVIQAGLCTHCGTCAGLAPEMLSMEQTVRGPLPTLKTKSNLQLAPIVYDVCPGKGVNYATLNELIFGKIPENWLTGCTKKLYIGYSNVPEIRRQGASGGVITQVLLYLLNEGLVDGAVVLRHGWPKPWLSTPTIACTEKEIIAASQSVYVPTPVNTILGNMEAFHGRLAYVGLPDQVASLRILQKLGHPGASKVDYVLGPYVGTSIYLDAIKSYLHSNGIHGLEDIQELRYREGEWPGNLHIKTNTGKVLRASKFYYNYLIPFYITKSTLFSVDFTNELTDISVGDAWSPRFEKQGGGFSVVVARSQKAVKLLEQIQERKLIVLDSCTVEDAMSMHGHMLDFKKRGTFIRLGWRKFLRQPSPVFGYEPKSVPASRRLVEVIIVIIVTICQTRISRRVVEIIPMKIIGPVFDSLRKSWKWISKPTKRRGLHETEYNVVDIV